MPIGIAESDRRLLPFSHFAGASRARGHFYPGIPPEFAKRLRYPLFAPGDEIPEADVMVFFRFASSSGRISSCRVQYGAGNDKSRSTLDEVFAKRVIATCREPDLPVAPPALLDGGGGFSFKQRVMFRKEVERLR